MASLWMGGIVLVLLILKTTEASTSTAVSTIGSSGTSTSTELSSTTGSTEQSSTPSSSVQSSTPSSSEQSSTPSSTELSSTSTATELSSTPTSTELSSTSTATELSSTSTSTELSSTPTSTELSSTPTSTEVSSTSTSTELSSTSTSTELSSTSTSTELSSTSTSTEQSSTPSSSEQSSTLTSTEVSSTTGSSEQSSTPSSTEQSSTPSSSEQSSTPSSTEQSSTPSSTEQSSTPSSTEQSSTPSSTEQSSTTSSSEQSSTPSSPEQSSTTGSSEQSSTTTPTEESSSPTTTKPTKSTQATTTKLPDSTVTSKPDLDGSFFKLSFEISIDKTFDKGLQNIASDIYKEYAEEFKTKLEAVYKIVDGFRELIILGFRNGSIVCEHEVKVRGSLDIDSLNTSLSGTVKQEIQNLTILNEKVIETISVSQIDSALETVSDKCKAEGICGTAFKCVGGDTDSPNCVSNCPDDRCVHGDCKVDTGDNYICSCHLDDRYAYTGDKCEIVSEKLGLDEASIIGIGVGVGGGIILLLVIVMGCICYHRRQGKNAKKRDSIDDFEITTLPRSREDKIRVSQMRRDEVGLLPDQISGRSNYGFQPTGEGPRYQRSMHDGKYQQTFFRQPSDLGKRSEMDYSPRQDYDYIDDRIGGRNGDYRNGYPDDQGYGEWDDLDPSSRSNRDGGANRRLTGFGRSFLDPADEIDLDRTDDSRRSSRVTPRDGMKSGLPTEQPMKSQTPLLIGSVSGGESVFRHIDTEQTYSIKRPSLR